MQTNALLAWRRFYDAKSMCYIQARLPTGATLAQQPKANRPCLHRCYHRLSPDLVQDHHYYHLASP
jgi:hypothetical protein